MSEDRNYVIFAENRSLPIQDDDREYSTLLEKRVFGVQDEDRVLEVPLS